MVRVEKSLRSRENLCSEESSGWFGSLLGKLRLHKYSNRNHKVSQLTKET